MSFMRPPNWTLRNCKCISNLKAQEREGEALWTFLTSLGKRPFYEPELLTYRHSEGACETLVRFICFLGSCFPSHHLVLPWIVYHARGGHWGLAASSPVHSVQMNSSAQPTALSRSGFPWSRTPWGSGMFLMLLMQKPFSEQQKIC